MGVVCPICLEVSNTNFVVNQCGHTFHKVCIKKWIDTTKRQECPICRQTLPPNEFRTVFFEFSEDSVRSNLIQSLTSNVETLKSSLAGYVKECSEFRAKCEQLTTMTHSLQTRLASMTASMSTLKDRNGFIEKENGRLSAEMKQMERCLNVFRGGPTDDDLSQIANDPRLASLVLHSLNGEVIALKAARSKISLQCQKLSLEDLRKEKIIKQLRNRLEIAQAAVSSATEEVPSIRGTESHSEGSSSIAEEATGVSESSSCLQGNQALKRKISENSGDRGSVNSGQEVRGKKLPSDASMPALKSFKMRATKFGGRR